MSGALHHAINFFYQGRTKENNVKFMHQSLCNLPKSLLLAAICHGFLRWALYLSKKAVVKYLPLSPATSKGHMKRPQKDTQCTTPKALCIGTPVPVPDLIMPSLVETIEYEDIFGVDPHFNLINNIDSHFIANIFCIGAFVNKITSVVYNNCTSKFPFMPLDGNVFFVIYHYKTNPILATPIPGQYSNSILKAFKKNFEYLEEESYKPKLNVMDNQATTVIKAYITLQRVSLQLAEPHNHRINTAERAIQTFNNCFIGALGTVNANFPIHLWDKLAPQVQDYINLLHRSCIHPYKTIKGPYDWNLYLMTPPGTKVIT
jgi:hypothetical protein